MKKSLSEAIDKAREISIKFPGIEIVVFDKKGKKANCSASVWVFRERILDGWHIVCRFTGGVKY